MEALASACGAGPDFLLELTCQRTLSLSISVVKLLNGHTEHAAAIKPGTRLFEDRRKKDVEAEGILGDFPKRLYMPSYTSDTC